jgi:hypothetical protein
MTNANLLLGAYITALKGSVKKKLPKLFSIQNKHRLHYFLSLMNMQELVLLRVEKFDPLA